MSRGPARQPQWEQPQGQRAARGRRVRARLGWLAWALLLGGALASVVWRQTVGRDRFRELERVREEVAVAQAERDELVNRMLELQRRERITRYAETRLGMHVARDDEVVLLPLPRAGAEGAP